MTTVIRALLGVAMLITGRRLYWLFVGVVGFVVGISLSTLLFTNESELALLAIALVAGVLGAVLALFMQRLAVALAGFFAGGFAISNLLSHLDWYFGLPTWFPFVLGGLIGAVLIFLIFDWALIILSSMTGASLLVQALGTTQWISVLLFFVLLLVGFVVQARSFRRGS